MKIFLKSLFVVLLFTSPLFAFNYNTSKDVIAWPGNPQPAKGVPVCDLNYNTTFYRVTSSTGDFSGDMAIPVYSRFSPLNSDGNYLLLQRESGWSDALLYSATDYRFINTIPPNSGTQVSVDGVMTNFVTQEGNELRWDKSGNKPTILYCIQGMKLLSYDVLKNTATTVRNFTDWFPTGDHIMNKVEGDSSDDGRYWAWCVQNGSTLLAIITYDMQQDVIVGTMTYAKYVAYGGTSGSLPMPNMVEISPNGDKVIYHLSENSGEGTYFNGAYAWDLNFTNPIKVSVGETHSGWAWDSYDNQLFVSQNNLTDYVTAINIKTGASINIINHGDMGWTNFHFARMPKKCKNWILMSTYFANNSHNNWAENEIYMIKTSSQNAGVWRIGHTLNYYDEYYAEAFAPMSQNGDKCWIGAKYPGTGTLETYEFRLPEDWYYTLNGSTAAPADTAPPYTDIWSPAKGAINISRSTNISFRITDSGNGVNISSTVVTVEGSTVFHGSAPASYPYTTYSGNSAQYSFTYNPPTDFAYDQVVNVTIDTQDLTAPANVMPQDSYSFTILAATIVPAAPTGTVLRGGARIRNGTFQ